MTGRRFLRGYFAAAFLALSFFSQGSMNNITTKVPSGIGQDGQTVSITVPANQTAPLALAGDSFYIIRSNATVTIKPLGGSFVPYGQGQGANVTAQFPSIQIQNSNSFAVTLLLWIGFGSFIDNQRWPSGQAAVNYVSSGSTASFQIPDLSGLGYTSRVGLYAVFVDATAGDLAEVVTEFGGTGATIWIEDVPASGVLATGFLPLPSGSVINLVTSTHNATFYASVLYNS
jgi:hypothetical protein